MTRKAPRYHGQPPEGALPLQLNHEETQMLLMAANVMSALLRTALQPQRPPEIRAEPPIPLSETMTDDYIVCLEDGVRVKSLKTYLKRFGLTPDQYRQKWGLPPAYPMVARALSEKRSAMARRTKPHLSRQSARTDEAHSAS